MNVASYPEILAEIFVNSEKLILTKIQADIFLIQNTVRRLGMNQTIADLFKAVIRSTAVASFKFVSKRPVFLHTWSE